MKRSAVVEVVTICLFAALGTWAVMSVLAATPASAKFPTAKSVAPSKAPARKTPFAVGDVGLFDSEDPNYCGKCKQWCDSAFFEGHSTQCDECQASCPGVRND